MMIRPAARSFAVSAFTLACALCAAPAWAQFQARPLSEPATGERYHIEAAAGFWFPTADITISSQSLGISGDLIDFKRDLGLTDQRFSELHLVLRPERRHKLRFQYIPIQYNQTGLLGRDIIFNGQRYARGLTVASTLDWKAYRFGYEYDVVSRDRGYGGVVLDLKYTDVTATLTSPLTPQEFTRAKAPIPAVGGIFRVYPAANVSITGEVTGFSLPESLFKDTQGHYYDVDFYGTVNFTNYIGAQLGYRSFDVGYVLDKDAGAFKLQGWYFGVVARY